MAVLEFYVYREADFLVCFFVFLVVSSWFGLSIRKREKKNGNEKKTADFAANISLYKLYMKQTRATKKALRFKSAIKITT